MTLRVAENTPGIDSSVIWQIDSTVMMGVENRLLLSTTVGESATDCTADAFVEAVESLAGDSTILPANTLVTPEIEATVA